LNTEADKIVEQVPVTTKSAPSAGATPRFYYLYPMASHNITGQNGEQMAKEFLQNQCYTILHQNWRHGHWEVDIIASKGEVLHFIEVKTRRTTKFGHPEEAVSKKKIQNLINASEEFLYKYPEWLRIQFDILAITMLKGEPIAYFFIEDVYL
jgi:putative endonuclease